MAIDFYEDALPALVAVAEFEPEGPFDWFRLFRFLTDTCGQTDGKAIQVAELLAEDGLIRVDMEAATFNPGSHVARAQITPKGLKLLDLWPTEDSELKFIIQQIVTALDEVAIDSTDEQAGKLRAAASAIKDVGVEVVAAVISKQVTG